MIVLRHCFKACLSRTTDCQTCEDSLSESLLRLWLQAAHLTSEVLMVFMYDLRERQHVQYELLLSVSSGQLQDNLSTKFVT